MARFRIWQVRQRVKAPSPLFPLSNPSCWKLHVVLLLPARVFFFSSSPSPLPSSRGGSCRAQRFFTCLHNGSTASSLESKGEWSKRHSRSDRLYHHIIYNHRLGSFICETVGHSEYRLGCESAAPPPAFPPIWIKFLLFFLQMVTDFACCRIGSWYYLSPWLGQVRASSLDS